MGLDSKQKLKSYIDREQIVSVLNDTKWQRLYDQLSAMDNYYIDFKRKDLDGEVPQEWQGDLHEQLGLWHKIEWLEIATDNNHTKELHSAIQCSGVPYTIEQGVYRIWGYLRQGVSPAWAQNT